MVYGALFCPIEKEKQLKEMKCAGKKYLTNQDKNKSLNFNHYLK